jgi:hypothetical protein
VILHQTINCERCVQVIPEQLYRELTEEERLYVCFQQDSVTALTHCRYVLYKGNPRTEERLKENIRWEIVNIPAEQLQRVNQNLLHHCEECLRVEGQHLQHLMWSVKYNNFIPNVIGQQAHWFIGKIRIRLAAVGAPVPMKRRTVNRSRKVRTSL